MHGSCFHLVVKSDEPLEPAFHSHLCTEFVRKESIKEQRYVATAPADM